MTFADLAPQGFVPSWVGSYPVLGIPTVVEASDPAVAPAVERAFGAWAGVAQPLAAHDIVRLRVSVIDAPEGPGEHAPVEYRLENPKRVRITTPGSMVVADAARGEAWGYVSRTLVADVDHFRYGIVEAMTYFLLSDRDRQPFHCAAVAREGSVVLLSGPPGAGKSTLAYAALRRGLDVMAEDMVWVQQRPAYRVWGLTPVILLPEASAVRFPELKDAPTLLANGQRKLSVAVDAARRPASPVTSRGAVCVLMPGGTTPRLERIDQAELTRALETLLQPGFDRFRTTIPAVVRGFAPGGGWRLRTGTDPVAAVACLEEIVTPSPSPT